MNEKQCDKIENETNRRKNGIAARKNKKTDGRENGGKKRKTAKGREIIKKKRKKRNRRKAIKGEE